MQSLSEYQIIKRIESEDIFESQSSDGAFTIKIEAYTPIICTAIHAGHNFRRTLSDYCLLDESQRFFEEDPSTDLFINAMPITVIGNDSRYEYDLNRPLATCIYKKAWGKEVWKREIPKREKSVSKRKHQSFFRVLDALIKKIEKKFGKALLFDIHSYNYKRIEKDCPIFNLGTEQIDKERWNKVLSLTLNKLKKIELPNMPVTASMDEVFYGRGYLISHIISRFENTLVIPLEIKKVYMDELSGEQYPLVVNALNMQFKDCLVDISAYFARNFTNKKRVKRTDMLTEKLDPAILKVDRKLYNLAKGLETLNYINPTNIQVEKKRFLKNTGRYEPKFRYRQLNLDPYLFREQLYRLPVDSIRDPSFQFLYRDVINGLSEKIDLLVKAGQPEFVYQSLKFYGEPALMDEQNAIFLLHAAKTGVDDEGEIWDTKKLKEEFVSYAKDNKMKCRVEESNRLVASAMVSNKRKAVLIAKGLSLPKKEAKALMHHELGVHMATTLNANTQQLKVFSLGLPGNTLAQEGLAILNEFLSGNLTYRRLKTLALRVMAVKVMLEKGSFRNTYSYLLEEQNMSSEGAFKLALRVHRGGGFTKDYLYLRGINKALNLYKNNDISNLFVGKTGFDYLPIINEMVERAIVKPPVYLPAFLNEPEKNSPILDFLINCISNGTEI